MVNKYRNTLLKAASQLDKAANSTGQLITLTSEIVENNSRTAIKDVFQLLTVYAKSNDRNLLQLSSDFNDCLLKFYGYIKMQDFFGNGINYSKIDKEYSLSELVVQLNDLVGLQNVKSKIADLISYHKIQQLRKNNNLATPQSTLHIAFTGNPGTGKTTVARIIGRMYKQLGLLSEGQFIEVSRTDLIAGYQGQTALKVKKVIEQAKGGVLFIDEAYSITENEHTDSYGKECLTELTKALEDYRDDLVVIVAGYIEPMQKFFNSNPGLKSRFNTFIEFDDYSNAELYQILFNLFQNSDYVLSQNAVDKIKNVIIKSTDSKTNQFANGRFVRNIYEELIMKHARRVSKMDNPSVEDLKRIEEYDI